jgi:hypothetical protein
MVGTVPAIEHGPFVTSLRELILGGVGPRWSPRPFARPAPRNRGTARLFPKEEGVMSIKPEITECLADGALALLAGSLVPDLPMFALWLSVD